MMSRLGFDSRWITRVMDCVQTMSYSFLINGEPWGTLHPRIGLRQGDPLFPHALLFLCKGFYNLTTKCRDSTIITGHFSVSTSTKSQPLINYLRMIALFLHRSTRKIVRSWSVFLKLMIKASGQRINYDKRSVALVKMSKYVKLLV